jgi:hypothetical protein
MAARNDIVDWAIWEADYGSWKPSAEDMIEMFKVSSLPPPSPANLKDFATRGSNIAYGNGSIAWCGIFACYVLRKWGRLEVRWVPGTGLTGKGVKKHMDAQAYRFMRPGDVAVIRNNVNGQGQYLHHHFIVTRVDPSANHLESVDGNSAGNKIVWHTKRKLENGKDNFMLRPYCIYQVVA